MDGEAGETYNPIESINGIRSAVESWRQLPESQWQVSATTARLLRHWRDHECQNQRPFLCQVEAVETAKCLTEVTPKSSSQGKRFWEFLEQTNTRSCDFSASKGGIDLLEMRTQASGGIVTAIEGWDVDATDLRPLGIACLRQTLCSATSETPSSFARCVIGLDQTSS